MKANLLPRIGFIVLISFLVHLESSLGQQRKELIIIDKAVKESGLLADCMQADKLVIILPGEGAPMKNLTREIVKHKDIDAIHLFFCGKDGLILLDGVMLSNSNLTEYISEFDEWRASFKPGADMLIYSCNLASSNQGKGLLRRLSAYTGLDIAASVNTTGNIEGDWALEFHKGEIESEYCYAKNSISSYPGILQRSEEP
jgi:hypothetical protein